jgi:hypothetical protein
MALAAARLDSASYPQAQAKLICIYLDGRFPGISVFFAKTAP